MDYVVIGAGAIGVAVARELANRKLGSVLLIEKEKSVAQHSSGRNSGVIHSGINQKPGSLKARMCVEGSRRMREFCRAKGVPMNEGGTLVVARSKEELNALEQLLSLGRACGVPGLKILNADEIKEREPLAKGFGGLLSPTGATVDSARFVECLARETESLGVSFQFDSEVRDIRENRLITTTGEVEADYIINCAGLYADKIAHMMGAGRDYVIIPFRGEYMELKDCDVRSMIYPLPDLRFPFLGIHLTRETDGRVIAGPSAVLSFGRESYEKEWNWKELFSMMGCIQFWRLITHPTFLKLAVRNARTSLSKRAFFKDAASITTYSNFETARPSRAGIRAQMVDRSGRLVNDMLVEHIKGATHVLNAVSPGFTCSLAFAEHIVSELTANRSR